MNPHIDEAHLARMQEIGAKAWAGVDPQDLRSGVATIYLADIRNEFGAQDLADWLPSQGYTAARVLPDGSVAGLMSLIFTRAICLGCTREGWANRFCFDDLALADLRFTQVASEDDEPAGYVARRRG